MLIIKINIKKLILPLALLILTAFTAAQPDIFFIDLVSYNQDTQQAQIHIQNTAGYELHDLDLYINNMRTGRIASSFPDGKAFVYYKSITPGTYTITIKTKEGVEFSKEIAFLDYRKAIEPEEDTKRLRSASELAQDREYQEYLE